MQLGRCGQHVHYVTIARQWEFSFYGDLRRSTIAETPLPGHNDASKVATRGWPVDPLVWNRPCDDPISVRSFLLHSLLSESTVVVTL